MSDTRYRVGLTLIPGIGPSRFSRLEQYFGDMEHAWNASAGELEAAGIDPKAVRSIIHNRDSIYLDAEMEKLNKCGITALTSRDESYPASLREIYDPPPVLYVKGQMIPDDEWALAVVGTRRPTYYGREVTESMVSDLARNRITIVSGLAKGVDAVAHRAALDAGGRTVAVLGCGLDRVYPQEHIKLASEISRHGALVSEQPVGTPPRRENFPLRNRIMSGISLGVLVIEADQKSGARITADRALEQGRDVFAVPGSILSPMSRLPNQLIQQGASLVTSAHDIMEELNLTMAVQHAEVKQLMPATETESAILDILRNASPEPIHIDELRRHSNMPIAAVSSSLSLMELKGMVKQVGGMNYIIAREAREMYRVKVE